MKHPERVADYLEHIAQAIDRATVYIDEFRSLDAFSISPRDQDAVIRNIEIIGEAAAKVHQHAPEFVAAHPELPWVEMRSMRNKVIHDYFNVDLGVVWGTVKNDLPRLRRQVEALLHEQRKPLQP